MKSFEQRVAEAVNEKTTARWKGRSGRLADARKARERRWCRAGYVGEHDFITREVRSRNYGQDED